MNAKYITFFVFVVAISLMALVPIKTNDAKCGLGDRFSLVFGQYKEFNQADDRELEIGSFACPAYVHEIVPNRLYIL